LMLKAAFADTDPWVRTVLSSLDQRQAECAKLMERFHNPAWIRRIEENSKGSTGPGPNYAEVKAEAQKLTGVMDGAQPRPPRIGLAVPSGRTFEAGTSTDCMGLAAYCTGHGINLMILNLQSSMISHSRNETVRMALKEKCDYLMWIDSDMRFPPDTVLRLLAHQKDIVCATYNKRVPPFETLGKMKGPKPEDVDIIGMDGLHEALLMPGGMILVKMDVYRSIPQPWYFETYRFDGATGFDRMKSMMRNYFKDAPSDEVLASLDGTEFAKWMNENYLLGEMGEDYDLFSEDLNFCRKARRYGFQIWCDMDLTYQVKHLGVLEVECKRPAPKGGGPTYGSDNEI
jgi:glycosyltransferase involved in cell wall biosynthesis